MSLSAEREENVDTRKMANVDIKNLNTVSTARPTGATKQSIARNARGEVIQQKHAGFCTQNSKDRNQNKNPPTNQRPLPNRRTQMAKYMGFHTTQDAKRHGEYLVDSGANVSMTNKKENLFDY
jgi:hypothetical protein